METLRPLLTTYAYNILGSFDDAKDVVQDSYLKFIELDPSHIENREAYLKRMVINKAINHKKRLNKLVRNHPGEWLPEPVSNEGSDTSILRKEVISYSMMVLMEKLSPKQRAVFILKEAFDFDHSEISELIGITEENCRQLLSRAKKQVKSEGPLRQTTTPNNFLPRYLQVLQRADTEGLKALLREEIRIVSDGGGKVSASINPIQGKENSLAMLHGIYRKFYSDKLVELRLMNHQPALFYYDEGSLTSCMIFSLVDEMLENVYIVRNPDKLKNLEKIGTPVTF
ncbi:sigma-70 family RNA polymerase sigma factor [Desertivirga brevis]|uniref:sigma-70 family RNA polymerase sigma factor n=1 Tax=Desertivirga brevis TaxID=2810310 RepID=UPI001A9567EB|nr:sigma-70 family RNA polymerase sigma factor [Pedobacter sp. SYSU D00873]